MKHFRPGYRYGYPRCARVERRVIRHRIVIVVTFPTSKPRLVASQAWGELMRKIA